MKKQKLSVVVIALVICLITCTVIGCTNDNIIDDQNTENNKTQGEEILIVGEYKLLSNDGKYILVSNGEETIYEDYRALKYYDVDGQMQTNHILVSKGADGQYSIASLGKTGVTTSDTTGTKYSFHGDYLIIDSQLLTGSLHVIGDAYGEVESVTTLEEGGVITFAPQDNGAVYSYFHGEATEIPADATDYREFPYSQSSRGLDTDDSIYSLYEDMLLYTDGVCYRTPIRWSSMTEANMTNDRIEGVLFAEEGTYHLLRQYYSSQTKDMRFLEVSHLDNNDISGYFRVIEIPRDKWKESDWLRLNNNMYEKSTCNLFPNVTWYEAANGNFYGYLGTLDVNSEGQLVQTMPDGTQKYYNEHLVLAPENELTENVIEMKSEISKMISEIDEIYVLRPYADFTYNLAFLGQVCHDEPKLLEDGVLDTWINEVYLKQTAEEQNAIPDMVQVIRALNIKKEDLVALNDARRSLGETEMILTDAEINALYIDDEAEMKKALVHPLSLYWEGEIYAWYEIEGAPNTKFDIPEDVWVAYYNKVVDYCTPVKSDNTSTKTTTTVNSDWKEHSFDQTWLSDGTPVRFSIATPSSWERDEGGSIFSENLTYASGLTASKKRMEVGKQTGMTVETWKSEWLAIEESEYEYVGPYSGVTNEGYAYYYYYRDPQIEKDVNWRIYSFLILPKSGAAFTISIHHNQDYDPADYLETVVLPAVKSVKIGDAEHGTEPSKKQPSILFGNTWYNYYIDGKEYKLYTLEFNASSGQMQWNRGWFESEWENTFAGSYSIDESGVFHGDLYDTIRNESIQISFTVDVVNTTTDKGELVFTLTDASIDKYEAVVDQPITFFLSSAPTYPEFLTATK